MPQLWPSANEEFLHLTVIEKGEEKRKEFRGTCAALSSLWLNNMIDNIDPRLSQPNLFRAQILQAIYLRGLEFGLAGIIPDEEEITQRTHIQQIMSTMGLTLSDKTSCMITEAVKKMLKDQGGYFISMARIHAVAAYVKGTDLYFYDPGSGLYCEEGAEDALKMINAVGYLGHQICDMYSVTR